MLVYRVEHKKTGTGPYVSGMLPPQSQGIARELNSAHSGCSMHPVVTWEIEHFNRDMYCGFSCIEKLLQWFRGYTPRLGVHGFVIRVYEAKTVFFAPSGLQIAFRKRGKKIVREISL